MSITHETAELENAGREQRDYCISRFLESPQAQTRIAKILHERRYFSQDKIDNFVQSKDQRIEAQYYLSAKKVYLDELTHQTKLFVLEMENLLYGIRFGKQQTSVIEQRINDLKSW